MSLDLSDLKELKTSIADRIYLQVASWHLYLGDAGLAEALAIECSANLHEGAAEAARKSLQAVMVPLGNGSTNLPLYSLMPPKLLTDLEEILDSYCK